MSYDRPIVSAVPEFLYGPDSRDPFHDVVLAVRNKKKLNDRPGGVCSVLCKSCHEYDAISDPRGYGLDDILAREGPFAGRCPFIQV